MNLGVSFTDIMEISESLNDSIDPLELLNLSKLSCAMVSDSDSEKEKENGTEKYLILFIGGV